MLIEFKVSNFLSIQEKQTFSLVASSGLELADNVCVSDCDGKFRLVRAAVVYGANAAGKSNLLSALLFMKKFILVSANESQKGDKIEVYSFSFDKSSRDEASEFEVTFIKNKTRYEYGFSVDQNRIYEEWLLAYPLGKPQKWFSREYNSKGDDYSWSFSKFFKGDKQQIVKFTRNNVLFLSNAVNLNNEQLAPIFEWFQKDLVLIDSPRVSGLNIEPLLKLLESTENKKRLLQFMQAADPSIRDINVDKIKLDEADVNLPHSWPMEVKSYFKKEIMREDKHKVTVIHTGGVKFDISRESEGMLRLLTYVGRWLGVIDNGRTLVVDELDNSLHPILVRFLLSLILNPEINKKNAQLIFSTHDTSILDNELLRRDQIWFVEKDELNATRLYSLLEFSPRKHEAFERGYLKGRYGGLPYIGEWKF